MDAFLTAVLQFLLADWPCSQPGWKDPANLCNTCTNNNACKVNGVQSQYCNTSTGTTSSGKCIACSTIGSGNCLECTGASTCTK